MKKWRYYLLVIGLSFLPLFGIFLTSDFPHTQYFPGWRVYVDGKSIPIQFQDPNWRGLITFSLPEGTHKVDIVFGESKIRLLVDFLSLGTFFLLMLPLIIRRWKV